MILTKITNARTYATRVSTVDYSIDSASFDIDGNLSEIEGCVKIIDSFGLTEQHCGLFDVAAFKRSHGFKFIHSSKTDK